MAQFCLTQAIKCKLAYIEPRMRAVQWSKKAKDKFEEKTQDKFMTCSVVSKLFPFSFVAVWSYIILNKSNIVTFARTQNKFNVSSVRVVRTCIVHWV